jgi:hypothetical protein
MAFSPLSLGGVRLWLNGRNPGSLWTTSGRSANVATPGDPIGCADDLSGVTGNARQTGAAQRPTWSKSIFTAGAISLDGADDFLLGATAVFPTSMSARTVFAACVVSNVTQVSTLFTNRTAARYHAMQLNNLNISSNGADTASNVQTNNTVTASLSRSTYGFVWPGSGAPSVYLNGAALNITTGYQCPDTGTDGYLVGKSPYPGQNFIGQIAELVCIDRALSNTDLAALVAYLKSANGTA